MAALLALPYAGLVARAAGGPSGDLHLLDDGALALVEVLRVSRHALAPLAVETAALTALAFVLGLLPLGVLLFALARRGRVSAADLGAFATKRFATLALLLAAALTLGALVLSFGALVASLASAPVERQVSEPAGDVVALAIQSLAVASLAVVALVHDLARAACVRLDLGALASIELGVLTLRSAPLRVGAAWLSRTLVGALAVAVALALATRLGLATAWARVGGAALVQLALFFAFVARASWLARALSAVIERRGVASDDVA